MQGLAATTTNHGSLTFLSPSSLAGEKIMQGLAAATACGSVTYFAFRDQNPFLKKYVKPTRVCFSNFGSSPKLKLSISSSSQRQMFPLLAKEHVDFAASSSFGLPPLDRRNQRRRQTTRAYKDHGNYYSRSKFSKTEYERPEWFWRFLSSLAYLISLKMSEIGFYIKPFLEQHVNNTIIGDALINLIPGAANKSQHNFFQVYRVLGYYLMVKNKDLPHSFRFHMTMGMLLEAAMTIIWTTSDFFPLINFNGSLRMYYGMVIGFSYLVVLLECLRCAIAGNYPQIPFISDAAHIHTRSNLRDMGRFKDFESL